jgi:hypothetical protein
MRVVTRGRRVRREVLRRRGGLNAGVPATQVAEWAGHSLHVLLKVYAKCIDGQEDAARQRVEAALRVDQTSTRIRPNE